MDRDQVMNLISEKDAIEQEIQKLSTELEYLHLKGIKKYKFKALIKNLQMTKGFLVKILISENL